MEDIFIKPEAENEIFLVDYDDSEEGIKVSLINKLGIMFFFTVV